MIKLIGKYACESDGGVRYEVHEYQEFLESRPLSGPVEWIPGMKELQLSDGSAVNYIDDETFEIVSAGMIVRRVR